MKIDKKDVNIGAEKFRTALKENNLSFDAFIGIIKDRKMYAKDPVIAGLWYLSNQTGFTHHLSETYGRSLLDSHIETALKKIKDLLCIE